MIGTALGALVLEVKPLAVLGTWEPVGSRLEALVSAVRGEGSLGEREITTLRAWARRWTLLPEPLRDFYVRHLQDESPTARVVLWKVLHAETPEDWQIRKLAHLWEQDTGFQPLRINFAPMMK